MDTSETYIKRCQKATEIQELADGDREGDFWRAYVPWDCRRTTAYKYETVINFCEEQEGMRAGGGKDIWLPRQDQLQEMMPYGDDYLSFVMHVAHPDELADLDPYHSKFQSWEQLWLAYYMAEAHNKRWTGDEWQ
jgi:hypothetical protein